VSVAVAPEPTTSGPVPSATRIALVVAVAHGLTDAYASFLAPLLPRIMDRLGLSIALAATLAMTFSLSASLLQPLLGYLADRFGRRAFLVAGPLVSGVFVSLMGLAPTFEILVLILMVAGLGSAAFHPPGASYAARVSEGRGSGARYSIFSFGGSTGFAVGPLVAVGLVTWGGLEGLWVAMIPVLVLTPLFYRLLPRGSQDRSAHPPPRPAEVLHHLRGTLGLVFGVSAAMAWAQRSYVTLIPIIIAYEGGSETLGALVLTVFNAAQAAGTLTGGALADRMDRRRLLVGLCVLAFPAYVAAVALEPGSPGAMVAAALSGFLGMATLPAIVVMAQETIPRGTAVGSGIVMGLAWAAGSVGVLLTGAAADTVGPAVATLATMPAILLAALLAAHPALRQGRTVTEA
jgi:FSR family fosmidomycin resistance protein-like MFS transporter